MKNNQLAWLLGGALVVASSGLGVAACSSDSGTGTPTNTDSGSGSDTSTGGNDTGTGGNDTGTGGNDTGTSNDGGTEAASCGSNPKLHPSDGGAGSLFCGYLSNDAGSLSCSPSTQVCCLGGKQGSSFADPTCNTKGTACTNGTGPKEFDCEDQNDCASGSVCCMQGPAPALDPCGYYKAKGTLGSKCEVGTTCAAGETKLCESNAECANGQTCTPFKALILQFGFCM